MADTHARQLRTRWTDRDYTARPTDYEPALADLIIARLENGEVLPDICASNIDLPLPGTFLRWVEEDASLGERYSAARRRGTDVMLDEAVVAAHGADAAAAGVRSRAMMWYTERSAPDRYGARATLRVADKDDAAAGIDHSAEIRRKLQQMRDRMRQNQAAGEAPGTGDAG